MNEQLAPFWIWKAMRKVKPIVVTIAGETVPAARTALMALVVLVLSILPGGVEVLAIGWGRAKRWRRWTRAFLIGKSAPFHAIGSASSLAIHHDREKLWGGDLFT
jgi:hypothetical protein